MLSLIAAGIATGSTAAAQPVGVEFEEIGGTLPDGTAFLIRVPENWNGTVINDLDYVGRANLGFQVHMLEDGYAMSGTRRHPLRRYQYDPLGEIENQLTVLDMLEEEFGTPDRVIQHGRSGGGLVAAAMAESQPDRIDGAVSTCHINPVVGHNQRLDMFFALRALVADDDLDLGINVPDDHSEITGAWIDTIEAAQQTPEGRARIALAMTLAQLPSWAAPGTEKPDPRDVDEVQESMYNSALAFASLLFSQRFMQEQAGSGNMSWTTGIDYKKFFNHGAPNDKRVVRELYREAGLDVQQDLGQVNQATRIEADPDAIEFWRVAPRTLDGDPEVPVFQFATLGDHSSPSQQMQGYEARVRAQGKGSLYRQAVVEGIGHCAFTVSENVTAVEMMMHRLDTGRWAPTHAQALNAHAASLGLDESRFIKHNWPKLNRAWYPDSEID